MISFILQFVNAYIKDKFPTAFFPPHYYSLCLQDFLDVDFNYELVFLDLNNVPAIALTSKSMVDIIIKGKIIGIVPCGCFFSYFLL
jgi:hypothetical protein